MRKLTFLGFLKKYLGKLSATNTLNLKTLVQMAATESPRLVEPLYLYAVLSGQTERLMSVCSKTKLALYYAPLYKRFKTSEQLMAALEGEEDALPSRYVKVYRSYLSVRNEIDTNRDYCSKIREVTLKNLKRAGVSNYRVYTDLGLNPGNINTYLKHGDAKRVSRVTADSILDYSKAAVKKQT